MTRWGTLSYQPVRYDRESDIGVSRLVYKNISCSMEGICNPILQAFGYLPVGVKKESFLLSLRLSALGARRVLTFLSGTRTLATAKAKGFWLGGTDTCASTRKPTGFWIEGLAILLRVTQITKSGDKKEIPPQKSRLPQTLGFLISCGVGHGSFPRVFSMCINQLFLHHCSSKTLTASWAPLHLAMACYKVFLLFKILFLKL